MDALAVRLAAVAAGFLMVSLVVVGTSRAAFTAATSNATNSVAAGTVTLSDNDAGTAMFNNVGGLLPGVTLERCIQVTYSGSVDPEPVRVYAPSVTGGLAPYLDVTVDIGASIGAAFPACTGFTATSTLFSGTLAALGTAHSDWDDGVTAWDPTGAGEVRTFRFRLAVQDTNAAQGLSSTFAVTWETRA